MNDTIVTKTSLLFIKIFLLEIKNFLRSKLRLLYVLFNFSNFSLFFADKKEISNGKEKAQLDRHTQ